MSEFPPDAAAALERGEFVEAVRLVREQTGLDLRESKFVVERYRDGDRSPLIALRSSLSSDGSALPAAAAAALALGNKLEAVKLVRDATGLGLAEAKDLVEAHTAGDATPPQLPLGQVAVQTAMAEPGRVSASPWGSPLLWLFIGAAAAGAWIYVNYFG